MRVFAATGSPSAAIVVNDPSADVMGLPSRTNEYAACVWMKDQAGERYVASVYCRYGRDLQPYLEYIESLVDAVGGLPLIVSMDANAVSPMWHSKSVHRYGDAVERGREMEDVIVRRGLYVLSEPSEHYTFSGPNGESDIDVTLVNDRWRDTEFVWQVCPDWGVSDYNVVLITARFVCEDRMNVEEPRWNIRKVDWKEYARQIRVEAERTAFGEYKRMNVERKIACITEWVNTVNERMLHRVRKRKMKGVGWWTEELNVLKRHVTKTRARYQRVRKRGDVVATEMAARECRVIVKQYKSLIREEKERYWRELVKAEGNMNPWGKVYKICRKKGNASRDLDGIVVNGVEMKTWGESVRALLDELLPAGPTGSEQDRVTDPEVRADKFSYSELNGAMRKMRMRKAPGEDGIYPEMVKSVCLAVSEYVLEMYNGCLEERVFPREWKVAKGVILLKNEEKVRTDPRSYRLISLLPVWGKILERMLVNRLNEKLVDSRSASGWLTVGRPLNTVFVAGGRPKMRGAR
ncbi:Reverse transcriptase (RNA-dependent DNA polymerase) [Popillia japonica]|uniref:Reverse transcriptase (RNA-dependent DNA polymerase) n=1 Tax=Popillia japonica TaxID=7064 RepID=A0AAW1ML82_POPJA